jgi:phosphatidylinositol 4-kinase
VAQSIREFEVLLALCKTAPTIQSNQSAQKLSYRLIPYILEAHTQVFAPSPFFRKVEPSPTESLAFHLTAALLSLGTNYVELKETVADGIWAFANACGRATESVLSPQAGNPDSLPVDDAIRTVTIALSLLGFLDAASAQADFWKAGGRLGLIQKINQLLSEPFLVAVETSLSTIRNTHSQTNEVREWKRLLRHYTAHGRPLGAMIIQRSFMWLVLSSTSLMVADGPSLRKQHVLDLLMSENGAALRGRRELPDGDLRSVEVYADIATEQMDYLEAGADFVRMGSPDQQKLAYDVKSAALISHLNCSFLNEDAADSDILMGWLQETLEDTMQMSDPGLAAVVLRCMALICRISPSCSSIVSRALPRFLVQTAPHGDSVKVASKSLAFVLKMLSKDAIISTLYTLGNVLSPDSEAEVSVNGHINGSTVGNDEGTAVEDYSRRQSTGSSISLLMNGEQETAIVYGHVVQAIYTIATASGDEKIIALAQSMLLQKLNKVSASVDTKVISGAAKLALHGGQLEFRALLKMYNRICHNGIVERKDFLLTAVRKARTFISANLRRDSSLFDIYWEHLLETIISLGDAESPHHTKESDVQLAAQEIAELLHPLAVFMYSNDVASNPIKDDEAYQLLKDAWFNIVVHGFTTNTDRGKKHLDELRIIAIHSPPLVAGERTEVVESDIELNTVLRRANSGEREATQKKLLTDLIPSKASEIKSLSYRKVIFLQAAYLVESLRADAGDCTKVLSYFLEPSMRKGEVSSTMEGVAHAVVEKYLKKTLSGSQPMFSAQYAATQLATIFCICCHRIERVQQAAFACADRIIREVPSALCQKKSLFALLELLSLMWSSCLEAETDLYAPRSIFKSEIGKVTVELSDDYDFRRWTLGHLNRRAKVWVNAAINLAPMDVKGLLQTYLSEF